MDIIAALHWTKDNIAAFGGDPSRVTVVGHDTGAALANLVLISKNGKGTFNLTISTSNSIYIPLEGFFSLFFFYLYPSLSLCVAGRSIYGFFFVFLMPSRK